MFGHKDLISSVKLTCEKYGISFLKYIFDDSYLRVVKNNFTKGYAVQYGLSVHKRWATYGYHAPPPPHLKKLSFLEP